MLKTLRTIVVIALALAAPAAAQAPARVALVIANANYTGYPALPNAAVDAGLVVAALRRAGFTVETRNDLGGDAMRSTLGAFATRAQGAEVALVYYAGHGMESGGKNWLLPTGAQLASETDLEFGAVDSSLVVRATQGARARVIVLDACRNNPLAARMRGITRNAAVGLSAPRDAVRGTLFMYSAAPGEVAADGPPGRGSPFARAFAQYIVTPGLDLRRAAGEISEAVFRETNQAQLPFQTSSLSGEEIVFVPGVTSAAPLTMLSSNVSAAALGAEVEAFDAASRAWTAAAWRDFLRRYPNGRLKAGAEQALASIERPPAPTQAAFPSPTGPVQSSAPPLAADPLATVRAAVNAVTPQEWSATEPSALVTRLVSASGKDALVRLADAGDARAQSALGWAHSLGLAGFPADQATSLRYFQRSAAQNNPNGQNGLALKHASGLGGLSRNEVEAVRLYRLAAAQGSAQAQANLGYMFNGGRGGLAKNELEATRLYRLSAAQGNAQGQANLGAMYFNGTGGVEKNETEAVRLFRLAAAQGNATGQALLAIMYSSGVGGLAQDYTEALRLRRLASQQGSFIGHAGLAQMHELGRGGLTVNRAEAVRLYRLAAQGGNEWAQQQLTRLGETW